MFGAEDYARQLGFEPHKDYAKAKEILGERPDALIELEFGRDGQPFYCDGPYDNPQKVIQTLEKSVGAGNFHYLVNAGMSLGDGDIILDEGDGNLLKPF